jgi:hypothetical protein
MCLFLQTLRNKSWVKSAYNLICRCSLPFWLLLFLERIGLFLERIGDPKARIQHTYLNPETCLNSELKHQLPRRALPILLLCL